MTILRMIKNNTWYANIKKKSKNKLHLQIYYQINTPAKMKTINTPGRVNFRKIDSITTPFVPLSHETRPPLSALFLYLANSCPMLRMATFVAFNWVSIIKFNLLRKEKNKLYT